MVDGDDSGSVYLAIDTLLSEGEWGAESQYGASRGPGSLPPGKRIDISPDFDPANIPLLLAE